MAFRGQLSTMGLCLTVFVTAWGGVFACSSTKTEYVEVPDDSVSDASFDVQPSPESGLGILTFRPEESHSGFDGEHAYTIPVAVYDSAGDLVVTASDSSAVEIVAKQLAKPVSEDGIVDNGKYFFVTMKKAGTFTLTAKSGGKSVQSKLSVASYDTSSWTLGESRYKNGKNGEPACASCHVNGEAIDHSPAALSTATDEDVGAVITSGISTHGVPIMIGDKPGHRWTVTEAERAGLVVYLRSLTPKGFK